MAGPDGVLPFQAAAVYLVVEAHAAHSALDQTGEVVGIMLDTDHLRVLPAGPLRLRFIECLVAHDCFVGVFYHVLL